MLEIVRPRYRAELKLTGAATLDLSAWEAVETLRLLEGLPLLGRELWFLASSAFAVTSAAEAPLVTN